MPHYKCGACRTRLQVWGSPTELVRDLCPTCGSRLQSVAALAELVGMRSIQSGDRADAGTGQGVRRTNTPSVDEFVARRAAMLERECFDAEHGSGGDALARAEAVGAPPPQA
jgi:DNA-directed RNA polymerase subunit RPC12/RpoP